MRIHNTIHDSIVDGPGLRYVVFTQGCPHHCPGCHNPETHDPAGGQETPVEDLIQDMLRNPLLDGLTLSGGEPFLQPEDCAALARAAHDADLNVWCYTGWTLEQLRERPEAEVLLREIDVLVDGAYMEEQRTFNLPWRGSANQRIHELR